MENKITKLKKQQSFYNEGMAILFILMIMSILFFLGTKGYFNQKFKFSIRECLVELDDFGYCDKYEYFPIQEFNLIVGFKRWRTDYYRVTPNTITIDWLEKNCDCWYWTCGDKETCNLGDEGSECTQYYCMEKSNSEKIFFVDKV